MNKHAFFKLLPNILTILRIVAIPFFVITLLGNRAFLALFIFVFACITDYFDGLLARKYKTISKFGQLMDPLADKFLVLSALILLCIKPISYLHWSVVVIIVLREISVTMLREYYARKDIIIPANIWGKLKTVLQMIGVIGALTCYTAFKMDIFPITIAMQHTIIFIIQIYFWIVVIMTIVSGFKLTPLREKDKK